MAAVGIGVTTTITLNDLLNSRQALYRLASLPLRIGMAVRVSKVLREVEPVYELCDARQKALLESHATMNLEKQLWEFKGEDATAKLTSRSCFDAEWAEVLKEPLPFEFARISTAEIESAVTGDNGLAPADLFVLHWLIGD